MLGENYAFPGCSISRKDKISIFKIPLANDDQTTNGAKSSLTLF